MTSTVSEEVVTEEVVTEESSLFKELFTTAVLEQEHEAAAIYYLPVYFMRLSDFLGFCRCFTCT